MKERILPPITFSEDEAKVIFFACQALQFYHDLPFEQETISILKKFLNCLPLDIQNSTIIPIGLYAMNGLWYCPAYCITTNEIREFRIDRIKEIIEKKSYPKGEYSIPASIQEYLEKLEVGNDYQIKIQLTDIGVKRCESEFLLAKG